MLERWPHALSSPDSHKGAWVDAHGIEAQVQMNESGNKAPLVSPVMKRTIASPVMQRDREGPYELLAHHRPRHDGKHEPGALSDLSRQDYASDATMRQRPQPYGGMDQQALSVVPCCGKGPGGSCRVCHKTSRISMSAVINASAEGVREIGRWVEGAPCVTS